ncbi:MAG: electron transfer flavoprotein subunit beta/FixA family protein [Planctomycetes bacterium]|nr:electron transfer flavoprotein subunit beta/FixA family protein [Planctomycetota bacterium]
MNIIVCVRRAPKTDARIKAGPDGKNYDPAGVEYDISEYDKFAIEAGLLLKEKLGGKVTAISVGPKDVSRDLRNVIAMGADAATLLVSDAAHDPWATASALAAKIKALGFDIVFCGQTSVDSQSAQTAPILAELLGVPCATVATGLEVADNKATVQREIDGGKREKYVLKLPAVISCQKGLNKPRSASMKGIMNAKKAVIEEIPANAPANLVNVLKMDMPPPRPAGKIVGEGPDAAKKLVELLRNEAKVI